MGTLPERRPNALTDADHTWLRHLLHERTGVLLDATREHFAEMRRDLWIMPPGVGAIQILERFVRLALSIQDPTHAVDDVIILRRELERLFDQLLRLVEPLVAVRERVTKGVIRVRVVGLDEDDFAQARLQDVHSIELLGEHRIVVQQVRIVGHLVEPLLDDFERLFWLICVAQQLSLGEDELHAFLVRGRIDLLQVVAGRSKIALLRHHLRGVDLRRQVLLTPRHLRVPFDRFRKSLLLLVDLAKIKPHRVAVAVAEVEEPLQIALRVPPVLELHREHSNCEHDVAIVGIVLDQSLEFLARRTRRLVLQASRRHRAQRPSVDHPGAVPAGRLLGLSAQDGASDRQRENPFRRSHPVAPE